MVRSVKNPCRWRSNKLGYVFFFARSPDAPTTKMVSASGRYSHSSALGVYMNLMSLNIDSGTRVALSMNGMIRMRSQTENLWIKHRVKKNVAEFGYGPRRTNYPQDSTRIYETAIYELEISFRKKAGNRAIPPRYVRKSTDGYSTYIPVVVQEYNNYCPHFCEVFSTNLFCTLSTRGISIFLFDSMD